MLNQMRQLRKRLVGVEGIEQGEGCRRPPNSELRIRGAPKEFSSFLSGIEKGLKTGTKKSVPDKKGSCREDFREGIVPQQSMHNSDLP